MGTLRIITWLLIAAAVANDASGQNPDSAEGIAFFEAKNRPVLAEHCYQGHSAEAEAATKRRGGLRLDTRAGLRAGGDSGPAIVSGKPNDSVLIGALRHGDLKMPPKGELPDSVIADLARWIEMGAPDPRTGLGAMKAEVDWAMAKARRDELLWERFVTSVLNERSRNGLTDAGAALRATLHRGTVNERLPGYRDFSEMTRACICRN